MAGKATRRKRSVPIPQQDGSWKGCAWSFAPPCWSARHPNLSSPTLRLQSRTWMIGTTGSMGRTLQGDTLRQPRQPWCMQSGMHGGRSMTLFTVENNWAQPWKPSRQISSFGHVRFVRECQGHPRRGHRPKARARARLPSVRLLGLTNPSGTSPEKGTRKRPHPKIKGKPDWPARWAFRNPKQVSYCHDGFSAMIDRWQSIARTSPAKDNAADQRLEMA